MACHAERRSPITSTASTAGHGGENPLVPTHEFLQSVELAGRAGEDRFVVEVALDVGREFQARGVPARAVLLQRLHHNPVQIGIDLLGGPGLGFRVWGSGFRVPSSGFRVPGSITLLAQPGARFGRLLLANDPAHLIQAGLEQALGRERRLAREHFVEEHAEAVDVAPRVDVEAAHLGLLGTGVGRRANERLELREIALVRQALVRRLGDAEVDDLGHSHAVIDGDEDVRGLEVAVDDALLMRVLHGLADLDEQLQAFPGGQFGLVAILGDLDAADQFHDEVGAPALRRAAVENFRDVRVVHERKGLALGLETRDDAPGVHAEADDLEGDAAATGSSCSAM
jgi:hypothetical protein